LRSGRGRGRKGLGIGRDKKQLGKGGGMDGKMEGGMVKN